MTKKIIRRVGAVLLCLTLAAGLLSACGSDKDPKSSTPDPDQSGVTPSGTLPDESGPTTGEEQPTGTDPAGSATKTAAGTKRTNTPTGANTTTKRTTGGNATMEIDFNAMYAGNVRDCGVVGDGKTDDTEALQRLLDNWPEDCTLFFPAGTYLISKPLKIRSGTSLVGEPAKNGVGGSVIKAAKSMDYLIGAAGAKISSAVYMNLTFDGNRSGGCKLNSLLDMPGFCSMKLANLKLMNCSGAGVHTYQGTKNDPTWISVVENIEVRDVAGYALEMINSDTAYNHIVVNGGKGILDFNYGGNVYNDVLVENSTGSGMTIGRGDGDDTGHICILNSTFRNNKGYGLHLNTKAWAEKMVQVEGCEFSGNATGDVGVKNVSGMVFYNNNFRSARAFFGAADSDWFTLSDNMFAQSAFTQSGYMIDGTNKFGVTSFTEKGVKLDRDVYDYALVYRAAALQCSSGRVVALDQFEPSTSAFDDNSAALQKAIDALGSKGGIVYVSKGTYGIGKKVTVPSNVIIVGENANSAVGFAPAGNIDTMFEIKKGATGVGFLNVNIVNPGSYSAKYFICGEQIKNCFFDSVQGNSNVVNGIANVIWLSGAEKCVVNGMICGIGDGGNMTYLKDSRDCTIQSSYISRGTNGTVIEGGSGHQMFNNHYDWFYGSAATIRSGATDCVFRNNYCDINQRVVTVDGASKVTVSTSVSRESGIPERNALIANGANRRELSEIVLKNAKNVQIIGFSSAVWGRDTAKELGMIELQGSNEDILVKDCICCKVFAASSGTFGSRSKETNNFLY